MTILSDAIVLGLQALSENAGKLCYQNAVKFDNVTTTSEKAGSPASNLANPSTAFDWEASSNANQTISVTFQSATPVDYIGIARHNLGVIGAEIRVRFNDITVYDWAPAPSSQSILILFEEALPTLVEIDIRSASTAPRIAVLYTGKSITLQRNIYVGHTPITYGRDRNTIQGVSQSGDYLGEVELDQTLSTNVSLKNLTPDWYRSTLDGFFSQRPRKPCFWAWRPASYPAEVSYCWVEGNPRPTNDQSNGMMGISWDFRGIA